MRMVGRWGFRGWGDKLRSVEVRVCGSPPSALPGISPTRGEIGKTLFRQFILNVEMGETVPQVDLSLSGEMPGRAEGVAPPPNANFT